MRDATTQAPLELLERILPRVRLLMGRGRAEEARELLGELPRRLEEEASELEEEGRVGEAMEVLARLTELDPWHAPWWHRRAALALRDGQAHWARWFAARAVAVDPHYLPARRLLASAEAADGHGAPAHPLPLAEALRTAATMDPAAAHALVAAALAAIPRDQAAAVLVEKALRDGAW